jgi:predicted amidohydrolase
MRIGAYQFAVTGDVCHNFNVIKKAVCLAADKGVRLLVFPECALTGYPPLKIHSVEQIDFDALKQYFLEIKLLAEKHNIFLIVGSVTSENGSFFNSAIVLAPDTGVYEPYNKRALWGWDADNFSEGGSGGVFEIDGYRIGVRICFEVRFPEYFRELYRAKTDINIVLFCDVSDNDSFDRYELIKAHLRTRAVENVCTIISANDISPYQTAPSAVIDADGKMKAEAPRNIEHLLVYDLDNEALSFGAKGRMAINDKIVK